eukprot:sb/3467054/
MHSKLKITALKKISQSPGGMVPASELFTYVKQLDLPLTSPFPSLTPSSPYDRSVDSMVLSKFVLTVSEIPLLYIPVIFFTQSPLEIPPFREAFRARGYFLFMTYLWGAGIANRWPEFKKFTSKIPDMTMSHFVSSYCMQMWLFNEIVKEPRTSVPPNSDIGLTPEKAQKNLIRLVKMAAKELEIEIQRVRVDSGSAGGGGTTNSATPPAPASFAEMIGGKKSSDQIFTEFLPVAMSLFPAIQGSNGNTLKYLNDKTGAKIVLTKMQKTGESCVAFTGTGVGGQGKRGPLDFLYENTSSKGDVAGCPAALAQ